MVMELKCSKVIELGQLAEKGDIEMERKKSRKLERWRSCNHTSEALVR